MTIYNSFSPIDIATSGMRAQQRNFEIITSNTTNALTTDGGDGSPYRRLEAIFKSAQGSVGGVEIEGVEEDLSDFQRVLNPGHPQADNDGYVAMPNVDIPREIANLQIATRAYEANAAILKRYQSMARTTLELLR